MSEDKRIQPLLSRKSQGEVDTEGRLCPKQDKSNLGDEILPKSTLQEPAISPLAHCGRVANTGILVTYREDGGAYFSATHIPASSGRGAKGLENQRTNFSARGG